MLGPNQIGAGRLDEMARNMAEQLAQLANMGGMGAYM